MRWERCENTRFWKNLDLTPEEGESGVYADPVMAAVVTWTAHPEPGGPAAEVNMYAVDSEVPTKALLKEEDRLPKRLRFVLQSITTHFLVMLKQGKSKAQLLSWFSKREEYVRNEYLDALFQLATGLEAASHRGDRTVLREDLEAALFDVGVLCV